MESRENFVALLLLYAFERVGSAWHNSTRAKSQLYRDERVAPSVCYNNMALLHQLVPLFFGGVGHDISRHLMFVLAESFFKVFPEAITDQELHQMMQPCKKLRKLTISGKRSRYCQLLGIRQGTSVFEVVPEPEGPPTPNAA
eukprot:4320935-Amphidinium_carterae.1